jgi:CheY-like chemotaxis protein
MTTDTQKTVLLVDDDADFRFQQKSQLEAAGYKVLEASGYAQALQLLNQNEPDIALVDLMMEQIDAGFALSYRIKQKNPNTPVVMITSVASETGLEFDAATEEERSWVKADAVLTKPVRFEQLQREMTRLLKG